MARPLLGDSGRASGVTDTCATLVAKGKSQDLLAGLNKFTSQSPQPVYNEVFIGGGLHAATWACCRPDKVTVLAPYLGGIFYGKPSFYLNSRNRPGDPGKPGTRGSLNYIPGGLVQPADLNGAEYQTNVEFALAIAVNITCQARRVREGNFERILEGGYRLSSGGLAKCVVFGIGLVERRTFPDGLSFGAFMSRTLTGKRFAVIGAGDTGKVCVEKLLGQGPTSQPASEFYPEQIDWFGQSCITREAFLRHARPRYKRIGLGYPGQNGEYGRIRAITARATDVFQGGAVQTEDSSVYGPYDEVIDATGFRAPNIYDYIPEEWNVEVIYGKEGAPIAKKVMDEEVYFVGPCANLSSSSESLGNVPENTVSAWRYVSKTAELAQSLI